MLCDVQPNLSGNYNCCSDNQSSHYSCESAFNNCKCPTNDRWHKCNNANHNGFYFKSNNNNYITNDHYFNHNNYDTNDHYFNHNNYDTNDHYSNSNNYTNTKTNSYKSMPLEKLHRNPRLSRHL
uniref:Uncharacterized protein n=1 Tax=Plectus sambesii TaxID=2011161 RepID=A0A914VZK6_9BILA